LIGGADLVTDRLVLRPLTAEHIAAVIEGSRLAHWAQDFPDAGDLVIARMLAGKPPGGLPYGQRQVIERPTGQAVGGIGLFWPPTDGAIEFGYGIVPSRQGRGYATEAARAVVAAALADPSVHEVYADVDIANPASVRVLEKAGLRHRDTPDDPNTRHYFATTRS
jgi:RimJ/RimL family protein N-acetyltransferase